MKKQKKETILVFCAHNDDNVVGAGATLAKYAKEGKEVTTIIFSYGELSHPWLQPKEITKIRVKESKKADKIMGLKRNIYLGLKEGNFLKQVREKHMDKKIKELIKKYKPIKIFTHSRDDPFPDHQAVFKAVVDVVNTMRTKCDVYTFQVWNPVKLLRRNYPKLIVDINETLPIKVRAFKEHKSQKVTIISLLWSIYVRALWNGFNHKMKYAEVFYKVR